MDSKASPAKKAFMVRDCGNLGETDWGAFSQPRPASRCPWTSEWMHAGHPQQAVPIIIRMMVIIMLSDFDHQRRRRR